MDSLERMARELRQSVFSNMRQTRPGKYDTLIFVLQHFTYPMLIQTEGNIAEARKRGEFFSTYYAFHRCVDDVADGDAEPPKTAKSRQEYVEQRLAFALNPANPRDPADYALLLCYALSEQLGFDVREETAYILNSMLFDAKRVESAERTGKGIIFPAAELYHHFNLLDVKGTIRTMLKFFEDNPKKFAMLEKAGTADRTKLTLTDLAQDLKTGIINIPAEEIEQYGISFHDMEATASLAQVYPNLEHILAASAPLPGSIVNWIGNQQNKGLRLIAETTETLKTHKLKWLPNIVLRKLYLSPSRKYFKATSQMLGAYASL